MLSAVLMLALVLSQVTLWLSLSLPILTFVGLSLLFNPQASVSKPRNRAPTAQVAVFSKRSSQEAEDHAAFEACRALQAELRTLSGQVSDVSTVERLEMIDRQTGRILSAIQQDGKYEASRSLHWLVELTAQLLRQYVKVVVDRGFYDAETAPRIRRNFTDVSHRLDRFWAELNRKEVVNLEALSEIIDFHLSTLDDLQEEQYVEPEVSIDIAAVIAAAEVVKSDTADAVATNGHGLTPREYGVLVLVVNGLTDQQIGLELGISPRTAEKNVESLRKKFKVDSRTSVAMHAVLHGMVRPDQISLRRTGGGDTEIT
jgi:DNA-binding CsgD family transcriptional regulator